MTNKVFFLCALFIINWSYCIAQDSIFRANGEVVVATSLEIGIDAIKFKKFYNPDGPSYSLPTDLLDFIIFKNREVITFERKESTQNLKPQEVSQPVEYYKNPQLAGVGDKSWYQKGYDDALIYYHTQAGTASLVSVLLFSPLYGLPVPIVLSVFEPSYRNLRVPGNQYLNNQEYMLGYKAQANRMKKKAIWRNYGIGTGVWAATVLILIYFLSLLF